MIIRKLAMRFKSKANENLSETVKIRRGGSLRAASAAAVSEIKKNKTQALIAALGFVVALAVISSYLLWQRSSDTAAGYSKNPYGLGSIALSLGSADSGIDIGALRELESEYVRAVTPAQRIENIEASAGSTAAGCAVLASDETFFENAPVDFAGGEGFTAADTNARRAEAVISRELADSVFGEADPVGQEIRLGGRIFTVKGVMTGSSGYSPGSLAVIPYTSARLLMNSNNITEYIFSVTSPGRAYDDIFKYVSDISRSTDFSLNLTEGGSSYNMTVLGIFAAFLVISGLMLMMFALYPSSREKLPRGHTKTAAFLKKEFVCVLCAFFGSLAGALIGVGIGAAVCMISGVGVIIDWFLIPAVLLPVLFSAVFAALAGIYPALRETAANVGIRE